MSKSHCLAPTSEQRNGGTLGCLVSWEGRGLQSTLIEQVLFLLVCIIQFHVITVSFISFLWLSFFSFAYIVNICMHFSRNLQPSLYFTKAFIEETNILTEVPYLRVGGSESYFPEYVLLLMRPMCLHRTSFAFKTKYGTNWAIQIRSLGGEWVQTKSLLLWFPLLFKKKSLSQNNW